MGSNTSSSITSHKDLFEKTQSTHDIMNHILKYMLDELTLRDIFLLSNPDQCSKYVIFMTNHLSNLFYKLTIEPVKYEKGVIGFRKITDLDPKAMSEIDKKEKESLCLVLSYYYTRIFQIYGALAITLIDDLNVMSSTYIRELKPQLVAPLHGGASIDIDCPFFKSIIGNTIKTNKYANAVDNEYAIKDNIYNYNRDIKSITFTYGHAINTYTGDIMFTIILNNIKDILTIQNPPYRILIDIRMRILHNKERNEYTLIFNNTTIAITYNVYQTAQDVTTKNYKSVRLSEFLDLREFKDYKEIILRLNPSNTSEYIVYNKYNNTPQNIQSYFTTFFNNIIPPITKRIYTDLTQRTPSVEFQRRYQEPQLRRQTTDASYASDASTPTKEAQLDINKLKRNLTYVKPIGHCIARALQLLNTVPLSGKMTNLSYICNSKFLSKSGKEERRGIPLPNETINTSPGLSALSQLFYDTVIYGSPKLIRSESSMIEYKQFITNISVLFEGQKQTELKQINDTTTLSNIKNRRDAEHCTKHDYKDITINDDRVKNEVQDIVIQMFERQYRHAEKCGEIFKKLFNIDTSTGKYNIALHPNIIKNGIEEVNRINVEARNVLVEYYENCETHYINGMSKILQYKNEEDKVKISIANAAKIQKERQQQQLQPQLQQPEAISKNTVISKNTALVANPVVRPATAGPVTNPVINPVTNPVTNPVIKPLITKPLAKPVAKPFARPATVGPIAKRGEIKAREIAAEERRAKMMANLALEGRD